MSSRPREQSSTSHCHQPAHGGGLPHLWLGCAYRSSQQVHSGSDGVVQRLSDLIAGVNPCVGPARESGGPANFLWVPGYLQRKVPRKRDASKEEFYQVYRCGTYESEAGVDDVLYRARGEIIRQERHCCTIRLPQSS